MLENVLLGNLKGNSLLLVEVHNILGPVLVNCQMEISSSHESQVTKRGCALRGGKLVSKPVHCLWLGTPGRVFSTPALELTSCFSVSLKNKDLSLYNTKKGWLRSCHSSSQSGLLVYIRELDLRSTSVCSGPRLEARVGSPYQSTSGSQQWVPPTNLIWLKLGLMEVVLCCCFCVFYLSGRRLTYFLSALSEMTPVLVLALLVIMIIIQPAR